LPVPGFPIDVGHAAHVVHLVVRKVTGPIASERSVHCAVHWQLL
jgi:hypothetical protein